MAFAEASTHLEGLSPSDPDWHRRFWMLLSGVVCIRVVYAAVFPLDLAPDESYYWDWGRRLDYGYFSKPPMIGWLMALAGWLGQNSIFGIKVFPVFLASAAAGFVYRLGRDMYGPAAGFWAGMALLATPANAALNTFFTIDAPLLLFWSASLWMAWRWWVDRETNRRRWEVGLAVVLGLGYLTKQIQLVFPVLWMVFVITARSGREGRRLRSLAWVVFFSMLFLLPPLIWNGQHDWITFRHTADELETSPFRWQRSLKFVGEFLGGQAGLGGGILWILMVGVGVGVLRRWKWVGEPERFLVLFFLPGFALYAGLSVHQRVEQNWPLVFYPAAAILLAGRVVEPGASLELRAWFRRGIGLGATLAVFLMAVPFVLPASPWAGRKGDPTARVRGWRDLATEVDGIRKTLPRPAQTFLLAPRDRYVASALAFYLPDHPRTYCWEEPGRPESQYGIWGRPTREAGRDALVIEEDPGAPRIEELAKYFGRWEKRGEIRVRLGPEAVRNRHYTVFLGTDFRGSEGGEARLAGRSEAGYPVEIQEGTNKQIDRNR